MFRFMNDLKTGMLLAALMAIFVVAGYFIGGQQGMVLALVLGGGMNVVAYFFSDRIALATMQAREVTEAEQPELVGLVRELAGRGGLPMPRVYVCPQEAPNAFATGRNPDNAVVAVTQGLLRIVDRNELAGVLAHELGHIKHRDILIQTIAATVAGAISALGYLLIFVPMGGGDNRRGGNVLVALAMMILAPIAAMLLQMAISRKREYNADSYGAELSGDPRYLANALVKLHNVNSRVPMRLAMDSQKNMFIVEPFTGKNVAKLFNTHPALEDRLEALLGKDGYRKG